MLTKTRPTAADYHDAFAREAAQSYPLMDSIEQRAGYALDPLQLEIAAATLACPVKVNPPNWQHGRLIYALTRLYLAGGVAEPVTLLDIGTAKGFSALCLQWALTDSAVDGQVISVDVIDPHARVSRNTVAEVNGLKTLAEIQQPWPSAMDVVFLQSTGVAWLEQHPDERIHVAFVDGKHAGPVVRREGVLLAARQKPGDLVIFDDVHIPDVSQAVTSLHGEYKLEYLALLPHRQYAVGTRR